MSASTASLARRHRVVAEAFDSLSLDALVITTPTNIRYLTNHAGSAGTLVLARDTAHLLVDFRYVESVRMCQDSSWACPNLRIWPVPSTYDEALVDCLSQIGVSTVGFEAAHLTVARHEWLLRTLEARALGIALRATDRIVERARIVKDDEELRVIRDAAARIAPVAQAAFDAIRTGVAERDVAEAIESALRAAGYERPAFDTIVGSGPNGALPHYRAGDRRLAAGDLVVLDFGGVLDGYCCDLTRTVAVGMASIEARRVYDAVRDAQQAAIDAVRPGMLASDVDAAARQVLHDRGLGGAFGHGTGHGLGLDVHEDPRVGPPRPEQPAVRLEPGMVFTIEPGAYLPGWGGVRIEDDVLVTASGGEVLTSVTRELLALGE